MSFPKRDSTHWRSASWRDSDAGYAGGRFAMDINAIWVPQALEAIGIILHSLQELGLDQEFRGVRGQRPCPAAIPQRFDLPPPSDRYLEGRPKHFTVKLSPGQIRNAIKAKLRSLPSAERAYWNGVLTAQKEPGDSLIFLALSLDPSGKPIGVVNTDPATELFLDPDLAPDLVSQEIRPVLRPYPVGLFVPGLGPLVANDAYASPAIWDRFQKDQYHSPRVVWGREVNLLFLGLAYQLERTGDPKLRDALQRILSAVNASAMQHNELWSYQIKGGKLRPVRYGTSSDVQLWNTTNLVVQYTLSNLH